MRYLFATLLVLLVAVLIRRLTSPQHGSRQDQNREEPGTLMVQCHFCGVYLPQDDAVSEGEFHYCSDLHRKKDAEP